MTVHDRYDDLIARLAARAHERCALLPDPVPPRDLAAAEERLGFALHPLLARLYTEIADGGFGPDDRFFPLDGPAGDPGALVAGYAARRSADPGDPGWFWPEGVVPLLTWGSEMIAAVDCRSAEGTVVLFDPNEADHDWANAWFKDADGLAGWLETSLAGTGWYADPDADDWGDLDAAVADDQLQSVELDRWGAQARARAGTPAAV
ncbi:SMI1/KNR4 family protein [Streptantibioticus silvisoli]|jgi:hypothetical protein|uniref:SMI1/KNR4 family protein n=1 Tax=Streptantibioticus silvisoli TaxID=2705255 RepID=A0ABT6VTL3_9ACTN|nr:SMI1/KNR4 family protein [Streptantibioticus silvisoli]MDI5961794.1 SMI1/KNR4 family protein [Streptantibioticus silvisoli]